MKNVVYSLVILTTFSILYASTSNSTPLSDSQMEAESIIEYYHVALTLGDTTTIKSLLGGDLLKKRSILLDNPNYPGYLISIYSNSSIEITEDIINNESITIDANIILQSGTIQQRRYHLERNADPASPYSYIIFSDISSEAE